MNQQQPLQALRLRPMTVEDIDAVYQIDVLSYSLPWSERAYRHELTQNPNARLWVVCLVEENGKERLAGMIVTWLIVDEAHIGTIAVHPDLRRRGIAEALLRHALQDAARLGMLKAYLEVRRSNLAAQALYLKFGFKIVGVRPRYYKDNNEDALLMTLEPLEGSV